MSVPNAQMNQYQQTPQRAKKAHQHQAPQAGMGYPQQQYNGVPPPCYGPTPGQGVDPNQMPQAGMQYQQYNQMPQSGMPPQQYNQQYNQMPQSGIPPQQQYNGVPPQQNVQYQQYNQPPQQNVQYAPPQPQAPQQFQFTSPPQPHPPRPNNQGNQGAQGKPKTNDPTKYKNIPCSLMYGLFQNCTGKISEAATSNNIQSSACGIIFYIADVHERDANNKPIKWKAPNLGMAVNLNEEQVAHLAEYLNLGTDPFGHGKKQATHPTKHTNTVVQPPQASPQPKPQASSGQQAPAQMNYIYTPQPAQGQPQQSLDEYFDF